MCSVQGSFKKQVLYVWNEQEKNWSVVLEYSKKKIILIYKSCIAFKLKL